MLQACDRVQIKAAARLGINRNTLHKKLSEFRLDEPPGVGEGRSPDNGDGHGDPLHDPDSPGPESDAPSPPFDED